jgi:hypothetical protein
LHKIAVDSNILWSFVATNVETSNNGTSSDFSTIYALGIGGIKADEVGDLSPITSLREGLEDEEAPFAHCSCKTRERVESLHML